MIKREALNDVIHTRVATLRSNPNLDNKEMSFTFVSTENAGKRYDWDKGAYYEEVLAPEGASFSRLSTFFKDHLRDTTNAIGKIVNTRVEDGEIRGEVIFGSGLVAKEIEDKYREEILTDVSIGYKINKYEVKERDNDIDLVTVTDYDIFEVSAVGLGFDNGAQKREEGTQDMTKEQRIAELEAMKQRSKEQEIELTKARDDLSVEVDAMKLENKRLRAEAKEGKRVRDIEKTGALYGADTDLIKRMVEDKEATVNTLNEEILKARVNETPAAEVEINGIPEEGKMREEIVDSLSSRMGSTVDLKDNVFAQATLIEMAARTLGINPMKKMLVAERAMTTSEFPILLLSSGNRTLEDEFAKQVSTWKEWAQQGELRDFRPVDVARVSSAGGMLDPISENGELKEISRFEDQRTWQLQSYGNKAFLTREVFINDDLGVFGDIPADFAERAANRESNNIYDILTGTGIGASFVMNDGLPIFHTDHGNLGSTAFSSTALVAAKLEMRRQTALNGDLLNITPDYLIVAPELEEAAIVLLASPASIADAKNNQVVNTQYKSLKLIVDPRLKDPEEWYLLTGSKTIKAGYLAGAGRAPKIQINNHSILGVEYEAVFDFTQTAVDYRGMYKGK